MRIHQARIAACVLLIAALAAPADANERGGRAAARAQVFSQLIQGRAPAALRQRVLQDGRHAIQRAVRNPARVSAADRAKIGLLSPRQRAEILRELAVLSVEPVTFAGQPGKGRVQKLRVLVKDDPRERAILEAVMGPNALGYMPASGHSYGLWKGKMVDMFFDAETSALRHGKHPIIPIWMTDVEASRLDQMVTRVRRHGFYSVLGDAVTSGRPAAWPMRSLRQRCTGNSCTTVYHRPPVGERRADFAWIDTLQSALATSRSRAVRGVLGGKELLAALDGKSEGQIAQAFDTLRRAMPAQTEALGKLQRFVAMHKERVPDMPLDFIGRSSLAELANVLGDSPGPGNTKRNLRASDSERVGVEIKFERSARPATAFWN